MPDQNRPNHRVYPTTLLSFILTVISALFIARYSRGYLSSFGEPVIKPPEPLSPAQCVDYLLHPPRAPELPVALLDAQATSPLSLVENWTFYVDDSNANSARAIHLARRAAESIRSNLGVLPGLLPPRAKIRVIARTKITTGIAEPVSAVFSLDEAALILNVHDNRFTLTDIEVSLREMLFRHQVFLHHIRHGRINKFGLDKFLQSPDWDRHQELVYNLGYALLIDMIKLQNVQNCGQHWLDVESKLAGSTLLSIFATHYHTITLLMGLGSKTESINFIKKFHQGLQEDGKDFVIDYGGQKFRVVDIAGNGQAEIRGGVDDDSHLGRLIDYLTKVHFLEISVFGGDPIHYVMRSLADPKESRYFTIDLSRKTHSELAFKISSAIHSLMSHPPEIVNRMFPTLYQLVAQEFVLDEEKRSPVFDDAIHGKGPFKFRFPSDNPLFGKRISSLFTSQPKHLSDLKHTCGKDSCYYVDADSEEAVEVEPLTVTLEARVELYNNSF